MRWLGRIPWFGCKHRTHRLVTLYFVRWFWPFGLPHHVDCDAGTKVIFQLKIKKDAVFVNGILSSFYSVINEESSDEGNNAL